MSKVGSVNEVYKQKGIAEQAKHRWRKERGGLRLDPAYLSPISGCWSGAESARTTPQSPVTG